MAWESSEILEYFCLSW